MSLPFIYPDSWSIQRVYPANIVRAASQFRQHQHLCSKGFVSLGSQSFKASILHLRGVKIRVQPTPHSTISKLAVCASSLPQIYSANSANKRVHPGSWSLLLPSNASINNFLNRRTRG
ncbi:hypothetical protein M3P05_20120 [Sansalvadorimonas sp. 2012CJ34-2]|uniref:Uncharacterized protein n=1 Tax=Parendozoicomonas callyspongiae TaxID=2942213 RepID=A0ABT0PLH0_9GAMM|nr:hypothetical protein [Sansalvadorimonas sp. 2012CJ34-2]MCL6272232.1 hypothetical protein [Sansalvadorimonas sp. 2012CJ34-2]